MENISKVCHIGVNLSQTYYQSTVWVHSPIEPLGRAFLPRESPLAPLNKGSRGVGGVGQEYSIFP